VGVFEDALGLPPQRPVEKENPAKDEARVVLHAASQRRAAGEKILLVAPASRGGMEAFHYFLLMEEPGATLYIPDLAPSETAPAGRPFLLVEKERHAPSALLLNDLAAARATLAPGEQTPQTIFLEKLIDRAEAFHPILETEGLILFDARPAGFFTAWSW